MALRLVSRSVRPLSQVYVRLPAARHYASKAESSKEPLGDGIVGKGDKNARPVILEHIAPTDSKDPDVKKHNEEFEKRPDRAANADSKKDQNVSKDFWKGQGGADRDP